MCSHARVRRGSRRGVRVCQRCRPPAEVLPLSRPLLPREPLVHRVGLGDLAEHILGILLPLLCRRLGRRQDRGRCWRRGVMDSTPAFGQAEQRCVRVHELEPGLQMGRSFEGLGAPVGLPFRSKTANKRAWAQRMRVPRIWKQAHCKILEPSYPSPGKMS